MSIKDDLAVLSARHKAGLLTTPEYERRRRLLLTAVPDAVSAETGAAGGPLDLAASLAVALLPPLMVGVTIRALGMPIDLAATAGITVLAAITVARFRSDTG